MAGHALSADTPQSSIDYVAIMMAAPRDLANTKTQAETDQIMDGVTLAVVLEEIARGSLPNALAFRYNVPVIAFRRWLTQRSTTAELHEALTYSAESHVMRAHTTLSFGANTPVEASVNKAIADRHSLTAAALAPRRWGRAQDNEDVSEAGGKGGSTINIAIGLPPGVVIPGLESFQNKIASASAQDT